MKSKWSLFGLLANITSLEELFHWS